MLEAVHTSAPNTAIAVTADLCASNVETTSSVLVQIVQTAPSAMPHHSMGVAPSRRWGVMQITDVNLGVAISTVHTPDTWIGEHAGEGSRCREACPCFQQWAVGCGLWVERDKRTASNTMIPEELAQYM